MSTKYDDLRSFYPEGELSFSRAQTLAYHPDLIPAFFEQEPSDERRLGLLYAAQDLLASSFHSSKDKLLEDLLKKAYQHSPYVVVTLLQYLPYNFRFLQEEQTPELCEAVVLGLKDEYELRNFSSTYPHIRFQTKAIREVVAANDPYCIKDHAKLSYKECLLAVKGEGSSLKFVPKEYQTEELVVAAIVKSPRSVRFILNTDPAFIEGVLLKALPQSLMAMPKPGQFTISDEVLTLFRQLCVEDGFYAEDWADHLSFSEEELLTIARKKLVGSWPMINSILRKMSPQTQLQIALESGDSSLLDLSPKVFDLVVADPAKLVKLFQVSKSVVVTEYLNEMASNPDKHPTLVKLFSHYEGSYIQYVKEDHQTPEMCRAAVLQNPANLSYCAHVDAELVRLSYKAQ